MTIFFTRKNTKGQPRVEDHTQVNFQGNPLNINTSNQPTLNSLKELQRVEKKGNCLINFMMKCNMDMDDDEDDLKERTQTSQVYQCTNFT